MELCTCADWNYLCKALTMYNSLMYNNNGQGFCLRFLAIDQRTYQFLNALRLPNLVPYSAENIPELKWDAKGYVHQQTQDYTKRQHYCWSLSSRFMKWLFDKGGFEHMVYVDSDICFYNSLIYIAESVRSTNAGFAIVPHLHNTEMDAVGAYNVSVVWVSRLHGGLKWLNWWKDCVCNPRNKWYKQYGMCGDQKYIDFIAQNAKEFQMIHVPQGAPWNFRLYDWEDDSLDVILRDHAPMCERMKFLNKKQRINFVHYSHFQPDFKKGSYISGEKNYGNFITNKTIQWLYDDYYKKNFNTYKEYFA